MVKLWNDATDAYFTARNLGWRGDLTGTLIGHRVIMLSKQTREKSSKLFSCVETYLDSLDSRDDANTILFARDLFKKMKESRKKLERALDELENLEHTTITTEQIGPVVAHYEVVLSCAHKALMEGAPPSKAL